MKLPISQILSQSWEDFKKLIVNPVILILFFVSSALSVIPDFIQEETSPLLALLIIPLIFLILFLYAYQVKLIHNIKHSENQNIFSEVLSTYPRYLWYTLIFIGITIVATLIVAVPAAVLYFTIGNQSVWIIVLAIAIYIPAIIYLSIRLFFYLYLIIIDKDDTPLRTSWAMTERHFWGIILLILVLGAIVLVSAIVIGIGVGIAVSLLSIPANMQDATMSIILLPLDIVASMYMSIAFLNTFLFCRARYKPQPVAVEEPPIN